MKPFEQWYADCEHKSQDPKLMAQMAWDHALCAAGSCCFDEARNNKFRDAVDVHNRISSLHSWNQLEGGRPC